MHGRNNRNPVIPPAVNEQKIRSNLQKIKKLITEVHPDVVTLQEVDEHSVLSGGFNQFDYICKGLDYPHRYFSPTCTVILFGKKVFVSGNAILSKYPLENCEAVNFNFSFPTERKGFIAADIVFPDGKTVSVTSVHLVWFDLLRRGSRSHQLEIVSRSLEKKKYPLVIAGDMNCDYSGKEKSLNSFVDHFNLKVYESAFENLNTSPSWKPKKRIDWILPSQDIDIVSYKTIPKKVSDHLAVFAILKLN